MNKMGMIIDLSHVSSDSMRQTLKISKSPVIFSHSSVYSLCKHTR
jgi:membrane dipeptidase